MPYPQPATSVGLEFGRPRVAGPNDVALVFGGEAYVPPEYTATITARFGLGVGLVADYDAALFTGLQATVVAAHAVAAPQVVANSAAWSASTAMAKPLSATFTNSLQLQLDLLAAWSADLPLREVCNIPIRDAITAGGAPLAAVWDKGRRLAVLDVLPWQQSLVVGAATSLAFELADRAHHQSLARWDNAAPVGRSVVAAFDHFAAILQRATAALWDAATPMASAGGGRYLPPPGDPVLPYPPVLVPLRFCRLLQSYALGGNAAGNVALIFGFNFCGGVTPDAPVYILPAKVYMVTHNVSAVRLPDGLPLQIMGCTISAEVGSFGWQLSATGPQNLFAALAPVDGLPARVQVTIDGMDWVFAVTTRRHNREFGRNTVTVGGISATYLVGAPMARDLSYLNTAAYTAEQLAAQALDLTGVGMDWGIDDWLVPTGAFSFTGTPLAAVQAIAQAAGGYLQSHRTAATLQVRHPYPTLAGGVPGGPWNWASTTADVEIAQDAIIVGAIEPATGPDVDGIYVSGTTDGVLALVRRSGTAGAKLAAMISDPLITAAAAAQQRGLSVLGAAGAKQNVTLELPVLTGASQPGVLDVGQLVQINDTAPYRGRVRSVSVAVNRPSVRQTVVLEQHL
jgi:hypothetical protein